MKGPNLAFVGGSVIVAIMAVVVFIGAANAGDCPRSKSAEATSVEAHHNADDRLTLKPDRLQHFSEADQPELGRWSEACSTPH